MKDKIKISVVVPVYNVEKYIKKCIESLISQTFREFEILLIDDGSTDSSGLICNSFAEKYEFINVFHKKNGGLSDARNYAMKYVRGQFVVFVDSDDYVEKGLSSKVAKDLLEKLFSVKVSTESDIVIASHVEESEEGILCAKRTNTGKVMELTAEETLEMMCYESIFGTTACAKLFPVEIVKKFINKLRRYPTYRNARHTLSILTITSNVVYGKATGSTPDGRKAGEPFGPGANPLHGRDKNGVIAVMNTIAKLPYEYSEDGISYTFSITPGTIGKTDSEKVDNLVNMLDGYFAQTGHHINVNVFDRSLLLDAMEHPEKYPQLTIRVSGYAVKFTSLTREQQLDVINRTIHERI